MKQTLGLVGKYFLLMKIVFSKPEKTKIFRKQFFTDTEKLVIDSIPIIAVISLFIGAVIVIQTASNIESPLIPKMYVGYMARESLILEFCSTMVALILAGKVGSNIASEIGSMRISEQIDAMEMMGINSANYLILPKIASATIFNPLLMLMSFILGLVGGAMIIMFTGIITMNQYTEGLQYAFQFYYIVYSMVKMAVFSFIITSISAFYGYYSSGGALGVGRSGTKAIVVSSVTILIANLVITQLMLN
ncbi:MAG: ABC transporter permease [Bacteroidia bacterium]|jgi:phospholipid/cholesterol/gamma-HCH transport system permease protein|nr:ABC transporter permease [Bacteroidales bacterium]MDD3844449.1 ABC transporter permease [Bacteroidales bacterium]MDD4618286.1 ABC transporter permease [Bacteroidales bacterium]NCC47127.1 ABC transporter permease [Bacteroidia bacterium]